MKTWQGPTPDDTDWRYRLGYVEAMDSPIVRAMYEALRDTRLWDTTAQNATMKALSGYEAGLREVSDDTRLPTP